MLCFSAGFIVFFCQEREIIFVKLCIMRSIDLQAMFLVIYRDASLITTLMFQAFHNYSKHLQQTCHLLLCSSSLQRLSLFIIRISVQVPHNVIKAVN